MNDTIICPPEMTEAILEGIESPFNSMRVFSSPLVTRRQAFIIPAGSLMAEDIEQAYSQAIGTIQCYTPIEISLEEYNKLKNAYEDIQEKYNELLDRSMAWPSAK